MKIYFAGSIRAGRDDQDKYRVLIQELKQYGTVLTEHIGFESYKAHEGVSDKEIYKQDIDWLYESDIVVAEVTVPSLGVGVELGQAQAAGKRLVCLFQDGRQWELSAMVAGNDYPEIYRYHDLSEVPAILKKIFAE